MPPLVKQFLQELGYVLLEHRGTGRFLALTEPPAWFHMLWGQIEKAAEGEPLPLTEFSPFLENFLVDAEGYWASQQPGECRSETWIEKSAAGKEIPVQAIALHLEGKHALALHSPDLEFREQVSVLQTARNALLDHERLLREIQKKEILLHCIIHDLSQPLSVMHVALDCISGEEISERGKQFAHLGKLASEQQEAMIRGVLNTFSEDLKTVLEAEGKTNSSPDLLHCAKEAMTALSPTYEVKGVRLALDPGADTAAQWRVQGEESRLRRIFSNLLENALRYSPPESRVTVGIEDDGEYRRAYVEDEGPGLPADLRPAEIFGLFSKGKECGGKAGLGLYFCRVTVERWGGSIGCASLPKRGSRFWFRLPKAVAARIEPSRERAGGRPLPVRMPSKVIPGPLRILFADDQEEIRILTAHQLERRGHSVVSVTNGREALDSASQTKFDVVLLDGEMPVLGGLEAARLFRERDLQRSEHTLLVALTGNTSNEDQQRYLAAGFDSVLGKPLRIEALDALFGKLGGMAQSADPGGNSAAGNSALADTQELLKRVGGDKKLLRQMIRLFLQDTPRRLTILRKAIQKKNAESMTATAHALKGSVGIFGAAEARQLAEELQTRGRKNEFRGASAVYHALQEEIAKLEANLRGYAGLDRKKARIAGKKTPRQRKKSRK